jgi:Leucine-rich repeat (LRR) protein
LMNGFFGRYLKRLELDNNTIVDVPEALMFLHKLSSLSFNDNTVLILNPSYGRIIFVRK